MIEQAKRKFLDRYNPEREVDTALSQAIKAAVGHNRLYHANLPYISRREIRDVWAGYLKIIAHQFTLIAQRLDDGPVNWDDPQAFREQQFATPCPMNLRPYGAQAELRYVALITGLRDEMNRRFRRHFCDGGFRISHSQKSISVFLKHLWCMGHSPMPIQCPIDRHILALLPNGKQFGPWTLVNDIQIHSATILALKQIAGAKSLAEWELVNFPPQPAQ